MPHGRHRPDNVGAIGGLALLELLPLDLGIYNIGFMHKYFGSTIIVDCPAYQSSHGSQEEEVD